MRTLVPCPSCGVEYSVTGKIAGNRVRCRVCRSEFDITEEQIAGAEFVSRHSISGRLLISLIAVVAIAIISFAMFGQKPVPNNEAKNDPPQKKLPVEKPAETPTLPPDARKEQARLKSVFDLIAKRYPCEIREHPNTMIPNMYWFQFAESLGTVEDSIELPIPEDVASVWNLFDDLRFYGSGLDARGIRVFLTGPLGRSEFQYWRDGDSMIAGHSNRLKVDIDNPAGHKLTFEGSGRIDRVVLRNSRGVSQKFDINPWSTLGYDKPIKPIKVMVDATRYRSIDGRCELDRDRFWRIAAEYGTHPDAIVGAEYAVERGFYPGRNILKLDGLQKWGINGQRLREDPNRPGHPDNSIFENVQPRTDEIGKLNRVFGDKFEYGNCFDNWPTFMAMKNTKIPNTRGTPSDFQAAAELCSRVIAAQKIEKGRTARWWEVKNEATIAQEWVLHSEPGRDGWSELAKFHNIMADVIHRDHQDIQIGGPSSAWMALHHGDFSLARKQLKFMDDTREHLDFYSHHFYEGKNLILTNDTEFSQGYLTGRLEGCLDLIRTHGHLTDNVKPLLITEYGSLYGGESDLHHWVNIKNYNGYLIRFMNHTDAIRLTNAFVIPVNHWDRSARDALFHYDDNGELVVNKLHYFLDFWKDYRGRRIPAKCLTNDAFIPMHCVMDGRTIQIALQNLNPFRVKTSIDLRTGDAKIESIKQTRLYFDKAKLIFETNPVTSLDDLPVAVEETTLITVTLDRPLAPAQTLDQRTFFADKVLQRTGKPATFQIDCPTESLDAAKLRIALSRNGGFRKQMDVRFNGQAIASKPIAVAPEEKLGNYWGFTEIDIPVNQVRKSNTLTITGLDSGGHVSTVVLVNQYE